MKQIEAEQYCSMNNITDQKVRIRTQFQTFSLIPFYLFTSLTCPIHTLIHSSHIKEKKIIGLIPPWLELSTQLDYSRISPDYFSPSSKLCDVAKIPIHLETSIIIIYFMFSPAVCISPTVCIFPNCVHFPQLCAFSPTVCIFPSCVHFPQLCAFSPTVCIFPNCVHFPQLCAFPPTMCVSLDMDTCR